MNKEKHLEPLYKILNMDCIEKLRVVDPRVHHYSLYAKLNDSEVKEIIKVYPNAKIQYSFFRKIKSISSFGREGFTIYNVTGKKRTKMIQKHDKEHDKIMKKVKEENIIF